MNSPGFMALVTWVKFLGEKLQVTILLTEFFEKRQFFGSSFSFKRLKSTRRLLIKHHMHMLRVYGLKTFGSDPPVKFLLRARPGEWKRKPSIPEIPSIGGPNIYSLSHGACSSGPSEDQISWIWVCGTIYFALPLMRLIVYRRLIIGIYVYIYT